ncbi:hypothetical protein [Arcanobacterium hippocoleae]|uniref:hypothetical protein n=1 Tax=Arcanobacterium hippocoleae TaxID=149017 RepID=UPI00333EE769
MRGEERKMIANTRRSFAGDLIPMKSDLLAHPDIFSIAFIIVKRAFSATVSGKNQGSLRGRSAVERQTSGACTES